MSRIKRGDNLGGKKGRREVEKKISKGLEKGRDGKDGCEDCAREDRINGPYGIKVILLSGVIIARERRRGEGKGV